MKKVLSVLLALCLLFTLAACSRQKTPEPTPSADAAATPAPTPEPTPTPTPKPTPTPTPTPEPAPTPAPTPAPEPADSREHIPSPEIGAEVPPDLMVMAQMPYLPVGTPLLPDSSSEYSQLLAMQCLLLCAGHTEENSRSLFETAGFDVLKQQNFDKDEEDASHTCAWTLAKRELTYQGETRTLFAIAVRGTNGGEWYSNFDFAPSHDDNTMFAENFLACAQEVLAGVQEELQSAEDPLILVCGHSRGAACANLIGLLLDETVGDSEGIFVYTFATPTTIRGNARYKTYPNIFNHINPCDMVPLVPLSGWGYGRAGKDIILPADPVQAAKLSAGFEMLLGIAPSISSYYNDRHSLTEPGLSEMGMTTFDVMNLLTQSFLLSDNGLLSGNTGGDTGADASAEAPQMDMSSMISPQSDLAPLFGILAKGMENGGVETMKLLMQHMPGTYFTLLTNLEN